MLWRWVLRLASGLVLVSALSACQWVADSIPETPIEQAGLTVTAVLAANTQIAAWRTGTAVNISPTMTASPTTTAAHLPSPQPAQSLPVINPTVSPAIPTVPPVMASPAPIIPTATLPPAPPGDLRLNYNGDVFTLQNISGRSLNITGLNFYSDAGELNVSQWDNGYLTASLGTFPTGDCLMAWALGTELQPKPDDCDTRHAWITTNDQQMFWQSNIGFEVYLFGDLLNSCPGSSGVCFVYLP